MILCTLETGNIDLPLSCSNVTAALRLFFVFSSSLGVLLFLRRFPLLLRRPHLCVHYLQHPLPESERRTFPLDHLTVMVWCVPPRYP